MQENAQAACFCPSAVATFDFQVKVRVMFSSIVPHGTTREFAMCLRLHVMSVVQTLQICTVVIQSPAATSLGLVCLEGSEERDSQQVGPSQTSIADVSCPSPPVPLGHQRSQPGRKSERQSFSENIHTFVLRQPCLFLALAQP